MEYYELKIKLPKRPLQLLKFRISTILLLMAIVAIALAWRRDHKQLAARVYKIQNPNASWGTNQVIGAPNTSGFGDIATAWASSTPDDSKEWLELEYDESVVPTAILIHETYNPGAVVKVTHVPYWGKEKVLWEGTDPTAVGSQGGVSRLPIKASIKTGHIKVYIDSPAVPGWNEIDAVGLEYGNKQVIWATEVKASSYFGDQWQQYGTFGPYGSYSYPMLMR
jgi:hypothetical protein